MATGMREKTTNVGGVIKRIWYAMTGETQGAELMSIDDAGKFKCVSEQISGLAGTGTRMVAADSLGNLSTNEDSFITCNKALLSGGRSGAYCKLGSFSLLKWDFKTSLLRISKGTYDNCIAECKVRVSYSSRSGNATSVRVRWNGTFTNDTGNDSIRIFLVDNKIEIYAWKWADYPDVFFRVEFDNNIPFAVGGIGDVALPSTGEITLTATADDKGV